MNWKIGDLLTQNNNNLYLIVEIGKGTNYFVGTPEYEDPNNWYAWITIKDLSNDEIFCASKCGLEGDGFYVVA